LGAFKSAGTRDRGGWGEVPPEVGKGKEGDCQQLFRLEKGGGDGEKENKPDIKNLPFWGEKKQSKRGGGLFASKKHMGCS